MSPIVQADVEALIPRYKSGAEQVFALQGRLWLQSRFATPVAVLLYEACKWKLPGGWYTPDFMAVLDDGRVVFVEVKGSRKQRGYRDARSKLRAAAELYPMFVWCETIQQEGAQVVIVAGIHRGAGLFSFLIGHYTILRW